MADWELRAATIADVETIAELRAVVMRPDLERLGRFDEHRVRQRFRDAFEPAHTWVIETGGEFTGCVGLRPDGDERWLEHFFLDPRSQGRGIGAAVLRRLLAGCDRDGVRVRLQVFQGSAALRLYQRHGFVFASEDPVDVFLMREPVRSDQNGNAALLQRLEAVGGGYSSSADEAAAEIAALRAERDDRISGAT